MASPNSGHRESGSQTLARSLTAASASTGRVSGRCSSWAAATRCTMPLRWMALHLRPRKREVQ
eukprot:5579908-Prorocentrum_lima.AAC.1